MGESDVLADEVSRATEGDPWFGPAALALLSGVDATTAITRLPGANHTIWEIVLHMTVWANYVAYRLGGGEPRDPEEGNWPSPTLVDQDAWLEAIDGLRASHSAVVAALRRVSSKQLDEFDGFTPTDDAGKPVTLRRAVEGVAQHTAYHVGQIAVLIKLLEATIPPNKRIEPTA